jgi:hypothetical protein
LKRISASLTGADWTNGGAGATRPSSMSPGRTLASGYALRYGLSSFSQFGIAHSNVVPLPIELLSFTGKNEGKKNLLEWSTASETNNDYFSLERSQDASNFVVFTTVDGSGSAVEINSYRAVDEDPFYGITYYRLKQTDYNGNYTYSQVIPLSFLPLDFQITGSYSDNDNLHIEFSEFHSEKISLEIYDVTGRLLFSSSCFQRHFDVPVSGWSKGVYFIKAVNDGRSVMRKTVLY